MHGRKDYGKKTRMITLPMYTDFYVINGDWQGKIIPLDGEKGIRTSNGNEFIIPLDYELAIRFYEDTEDDDILY